MTAGLEARAQALADAFKWACLSELEAIKPGNVHIFSDGHGMVVEDFVKSADAASRVIAQPGLTVGERIYAAVENTWDAVGCNTNLGILLLCAPMAHAALEQGGGRFREQLAVVLAQLSVADAEATFRAIAKASPAGLGNSVHYDVHEQASVSLLHAMREAQDRDRIAWQYAHEFSDILDFGLSRYRDLFARWERPAWATTGVYLGFLARQPDTHIVRKHGEALARMVKDQAAIHELETIGLENPKLYQRNLLDFDANLKARGLNPGTSADLTVATLFAHAIEQTVR